MRIGFIGIGNVGEPVVHNLLAKGFAVAVNDIDRDRTARVIGEGAEWAETPAAAAAGADAVVTALPGPPQVRVVVEGSDGVAASIGSDAVWIDMSTTTATRPSASLRYSRKRVRPPSRPAAPAASMPPGRAT